MLRSSRQRLKTRKKHKCLERALLWPVMACALIVWTAFPQRRPGRAPEIREVNVVLPGDATKTLALSGATLIDGLGGAAVPDSIVLVRGERIVAAGPRTIVDVPKEAETLNLHGSTILPGLIDAHFHLDSSKGLPAQFLKNGITSVRDPGQWLEAYDEERKSGAPIPRLFLAGPHLDTPPAAYPADSIIVRDAQETENAVTRFIEQGASAIKVYFRLPLDLIRVATETAHARGVPVTAHLEIVDARDALEAGVDGFEHVTSLGTALLDLREAEKYRQAVLADNAARRDGRYRMWSELDLGSPKVSALAELLAKRGAFLSPTLAVFERRAGDRGVSDFHVRGFQNMLRFVGLARRAGVRVVVGSHSSVPHALQGWAYHREMELFVESGMTPMQAIVAGTLENARFFRIQDRLGSIEPGKLADLVVVQGNPAQDITAMRRIQRVMLNGRWIPP